MQPQAHGHLPAIDTGFRSADVVFPLVIAALLVWLSFVSFLWFHTLAELFAVIVGAALYLIARHSVALNRNSFLLFVAQGLFWAGCIDTIHTLAYSGMGLIPGNDPNPPTQLWLCARFIEAATLLIAPRYLDGREIEPWTFAAFGTAAIGGIALVFRDGFPDAFIAGQGLTAFKIGAEYAIIALLALAAWRLHRKRQSLNATLFRMLLAVIALTIVSEFAFTRYVSVFGLSNLVGHICKFWAYWLVLMIVSRWMLAEPFRMLAQEASSFETVPMPVLILDSHGVVQYCNESARQQRPQGGIGHTIHEAWHPADSPLAECDICQAIAAGDSIGTVLHDRQRNEWSGIRLHPIQLDNKAQGFICFQTDITERKRAEERLAHAEKLEMIGRMTGGLAHDFNNLMGMVLGGLGLIAAKLPDDEKTRNHFNIASQAAHRAADVTKSLLAVARKQPLDPRILNIRNALAEMVPLLRQSAGKETTVEEVQCNACEPSNCERCILASVDPAGLGNTILNLVINARDAMPHGGQIRIDTRVRTLAGDAAGQPIDLAPGRYVIITVTDTGQGMSPQVAARALEPFFSTKDTGKGTGLGLAMVYGFARQSGGTATIHSQPGLGTSVRIYLPAIGERTQATGSGNSDDIANGKGERILVVDDEANLLTIAREWLESLGYRVTVAYGPASAMDHLRREPFDLLLTDIIMPGQSDGVTLAGEATALQPSLRVLLASGFPGDILNAGRQWPLLEKPYARSDLARMVSQALN